jgi:hypothetical protein
MHGTPAQALFAKNRRDFSHGCVRVADPVALAEWVLREHPAWTFSVTPRSAWTSTSPIRYTFVTSTRWKTGLVQAVITRLVPSGSRGAIVVLRPTS